MSKKEHFVYIDNDEVQAFARLLSLDGDDCAVELLLSGKSLTVSKKDLLRENQIHPSGFQWAVRSHGDTYLVIFAIFLSREEVAACWQYIDLSIYESETIEQDIRKHGYDSLEKLKSEAGNWQEFVALCIAKNRAKPLEETVDIRSFQHFLASHSLREGESSID